MKHARILLALALLTACAPDPMEAPNSPANRLGHPSGAPILRHERAATLHVYADFRCPHCARFAVSHLPALTRDFRQEIIDGTLVVEHRNFPILGESSQFLAQLSECAARQGRFQAFHDALYSHQYRAATDPRLQHVDGPGAELDQILALSATDPAAARACMATDLPVNALRFHLDQARRLSLRYTPSLVLNERLIHWDDYDHIVRQVRDAIPTLTTEPSP